MGVAVTPSRDQYATAIAKTVGCIPEGHVCSYGRVAELSGLPRRARLVGRVLREFPDSANLPWHRVVRASGQLAFPPGSDAYCRQALRLRAEGVPVSGGRVDVGQYGWQMTLEQRLWGSD